MFKTRSTEEKTKEKPKKKAFATKKTKPEEDEDDMEARDVDVNMLKFENIMGAMGVGASFNFDNLSDASDDEETKQ
jgi:hypothetical protein